MTTTTGSLTDGLSVVAQDFRKSRVIKTQIRARSAQVRAEHPVLAHQTALGVAWLALAVVGAAASGAGYLTGVLPWWATIPISAFFLSIAHEVEHDTIHRLYFRDRPRGQDVMLAVAWLVRPYTANPWARREVHLLHHKASGTAEDLEERAISNGMRWTPLRLLCMLDLVAASIGQLIVQKERRHELSRFALRAFFPLTYVAFALWYGFLISHLAGHPIGWLDAAVVVWIAPNILRVACLHFVSSNIHYYGDVGLGDLVEQVQVLTHPAFLPAQLFCANFGSTHGIHHFVPNDPFYLRQMTSRAAHRAMRENGVRFNDLGTFRRANRYTR